MTINRNFSHTPLDEANLASAFIRYISASGVCVTPLMVVLGLMSTYLTLLVVQKPTVIIYPTVRLYYRWMTVSGLLSIIVRDLLLIFLCYGSYFAWSAHPPEVLLQFTNFDWICRVSTYFTYVTELTANLSCLIMILERLISLLCPFFASKVVNTTNAIKAMYVVLVFAVVISFGPAMVVRFGLVSSTDYLQVCLPGPGAADYGVAMSIIAFLFCHVLNFAAGFACCLVTLARVDSIIGSSNALGRGTSLRHRGTQIVALSVILQLIKSILHIPYGVGLIALTLAAQDCADCEITSVLTWVVVSNTPFIIIPHCITFLFHCKKIPGFEKTAKSIIFCRSTE